MWSEVYYAVVVVFLTVTVLKGTFKKNMTA
jgi:hypothetical protein